MCRHCDRPVRAMGLCDGHLTRLHNGTPMTEKPLRKRRGRPYEMLAVPVSYDTAHNRCRVMWGTAANYPCVGCGGKAREWAYDGTDPTELQGFGTGDRRDCLFTYSIWPEFYLPMCRKCHSIFDHGPGEEPSDQPPW